MAGTGLGSHLDAIRMPTRRRAQGASRSLKISLALAPFPYSGLIAIADDKGFFKESGIEVSVKEYAYGFATLDALSRGETQVAMGNDLVFAQKISRDPSLRIVASIAMADTNGIVARKDRDIHKPSDLKGKRIGIVPNTSSEYFFTTFLLVNKIPVAEATAVRVPPDRIVEAIVSGEVDAISSGTPMCTRQKTPGGKRRVLAVAKQPGLALDFGRQGEHDPIS